MQAALIYRKECTHDTDKAMTSLTCFSNLDCIDTMDLPAQCCEALIACILVTVLCNLCELLISLCRLHGCSISH